MYRLDILWLSQPIVPTPDGELYCRPGIGLMRVGVMNVGGEELDEAFACIWARSEQRRQRQSVCGEEKVIGHD